MPGNQNTMSVYISYGDEPGLHVPFRLQIPYMQSEAKVETDQGENRHGYGEQLHDNQSRVTDFSVVHTMAANIIQSSAQRICRSSPLP
jgi:hypothetical protein